VKKFHFSRPKKKTPSFSVPKKNMLVWNGGARAKLATQQQQQQQNQQQFPPPLGVKRVGFQQDDDDDQSGGGGGSSDLENDGNGEKKEGKRVKVDTLMGFPLPPRPSFTGKYDTEAEKEAGKDAGRGPEEEEDLIPASAGAAAAPAAGKNDGGCQGGEGRGGERDEAQPMSDEKGEASDDPAAAGACSLEAEAGDTPANEAEMETEPEGRGTASAAATETVPATATASARPSLNTNTNKNNNSSSSSVPLAPPHRRRRHVFVLRGSRSVRNLDLETIDL